MKTFFILLAAVTFSVKSNGQESTDSAKIKQVVNAFFTSWNNHNFNDMATYTTEDVNWISHFGSWTKGRESVQRWSQTPHNVLLKTASTKLESMSIRFITQDVAIVNLIHKTGTFYPPDGVDRGNNKREGRREIKSMVVVKQNKEWLLSHNHTTLVQDSVKYK